MNFREDYICLVTDSTATQILALIDIQNTSIEIALKIRLLVLCRKVSFSIFHRYNTYQDDVLYLGTPPLMS